MKRSFDFYEFAGIVVPGVVLVLGLLWLTPGARELFGKDGLTFGDLGLFLIIGYAAGQLVQGIGNWLEWAWWCAWGGLPGHRALGGDLVSAEQHKRILEALKRDGTCAYGIPVSSASESLAIVRQVYSVVATSGNTTRIDTFNGNYALLRGLAAAVLVLLVVSVTMMKGIYIIGALTTLFVLALQRMHSFAKHYARELFIQYMLVSGPPRSDRGSGQ